MTLFNEINQMKKRKILFSIILLFIVILLWLVCIIQLSQSNYEIFSYSASLQAYKNKNELLYVDEWDKNEKLTNNSIAEKPIFFPLLELIANWNPDNTEKNMWNFSVSHPRYGKNIKRFDYSNKIQRKVALNYRNEEIPFIIYNIPELNHAIDLFTINNLLKNFGSTERIVEQSIDNHFMYYTAKKVLKSKSKFPDWKPPQQDVKMSFSTFLKEAQKADKFVNKMYNSDNQNDNMKFPSLYYLTISAGEVKL
jgi:hypothetical protein